MVRSLFLAICFLASPCWAGVYTYLDADGNRVFTDRPPDNHPVEQVAISTSNRMEAVRPPPATRRMLAPPAPELRYEVLRILSPTPDTTLRGDAGQLIVTATSEPPLHTGHSFRLVMNNQVVAVQQSPVFALSNIDRGTHQVAVEIIDQEERIIERTPSQPVHVKRTTLSDRRRANPCQLEDYGKRHECPLKDKPKEKDIPFVPFI